MEKGFANRPTWPKGPLAATTNTNAALFSRQMSGSSEIRELN
jgi:hypothetical protein